MLQWMRLRYRVSAVLLMLVILGGCVIVGLKHMMPIEKERSVQQQARSDDIGQLMDNIVPALSEDNPNAVESAKLIQEAAQAIKHDAVLSERWHAAGEEALGPPEGVVIRAGSDEESGVLVQFEDKANTLGKVRGAIRQGRGILLNSESGGLSGGWALGGGGALLGLLTGAAEMGRRKLRSMERKRTEDLEEERTRQRREQQERDQAQDTKMDAMVNLFNARLVDMEQSLLEKVKSLGKPTA